MSNKTMVKFYKGSGNPLVKTSKLVDAQGTVKHVFKSANEMKAWRKTQKALKRKAFKASKEV